MKQVYCLFGVESYFLHGKIKEIAKEHEMDENDIVKYNMMDHTLDEVMVDANNMSLFSFKKMIVCYDCTFLTAKRGEQEAEEDVLEDLLVEKDEPKLDALFDYLEHPNPDTILVLVMESIKLDERKKIVKQLRKNATVLEFPKLTNDELFEYIKKELIKRKKRMRSDVIHSLMEKTSGNVSIIHSELEKLTLYKDQEEEITMEDVNTLVRKVDADNVFDLADAIIQKRTQDILQIYHELIESNQEPIRILIFLANQFRLFYQTKVLKEEGYNIQTIAGMLGVHWYRVKLASELNISTSKLLGYLEELADLDYGIKSGTINKELGLELFLIKI